MINSRAIYDNLRYGQEYDLYTDRELIKKFNVGNKEAEKCLMKRYFYLIRRIVNSFYIEDRRKDDILQESMIGLFKAMKTYDERYDVSFKTYAEICIRRQIISALRKSEKYETVNIFTVFNCFESDSEYDFTEQMYDDSYNPENILMYEEEKKYYIEFASQYLSDYENSVLKEYFNGRTYKEIAEVLNTNLKSVDNALQRVKKKTFNKRTLIATQTIWGNT
jgi:RNA polymerase sporulation-specific sigma factor